MAFKNIYLFLAALGLCWWAWAHSSGGKWGLLFVAVHRLLIAVPSLVVEHRLTSRASVVAIHRLGVVAHGLQSWGSVLKVQGLVVLWNVQSSQTRNQTHVSCIGRRILIHCTTREVQELLFLTSTWMMVMIQGPHCKPLVCGIFL